MQRTLKYALTGAAFALLAVVFNSRAAEAEPGNSVGKPNARNNAYIVQMADMPVTAYKGGIKGYAATKPRKGQKIDPNSPAVVSYMAYLASRQDVALNSVGGGKKLYNYGYVFNGFAADLTPAQAQKLAQTKGVLAVTKDEIRKLDTASTPAFLGLTGNTGFWATKAKGEGVVIGIVDSGIWPEHPSFSDRTDVNGNGTKDGKLGYQQIAGWHGKCTPGEAFTAANCNQKLIGAQFFNAGFGGNAGIKASFPYEFNSPRDADGHGSHTASTAGGNANVAATGPAAVFGSINGIAPRARISAYKVCWGNNGEGGCAGVDSVAAIDQAVADGVDVINFSISGTRTNFRDPVEIAFLFAADAGVFVAASAGNEGPGSSTVAHPSPWITTVAAGTHNRDGLGSVTLGNGATYSGASFAAALGASSMVDSANAVKSGSAAGDAELCVPGTLDMAVVVGKIVLCKRGGIALVDKSRAVAEAGGAGAVIYNDPASTATNTLALFHSVPTVHVVAASGLAIKTYIAAASGPTASISQSMVVLNAAAPFTATFSSRGPLRGGNGDLLKPDLIAPGQDIVAAVSPIGYNGRTFDLLSGTSMSSPHVAGLAALLKELKPTWSPMAIKSALMTTGTDVLDGGTPPAGENSPALIFRQGAGHVQPMAAANPGLVFDSSFADWLSFICSVQPGGGCTNVTLIDPSNLNVPSIAIGDMAGKQTVTRKVTNVSGNTATFTASVTGIAGFSAVVSPSSLTLNAGQSGTFTVAFTRTTAALNAYTGGQLRWTNGVQTARIPIVVRPVALAAPAQVGAGSYNVAFGYSGPFTATARGLIPAAVTAGTVTQDPDQTFDPVDPTGTVAIPVVIPAGTTYARFSLFDADVAPGADIDLYVYQGATLVGLSGSGTSAEEVNFTFPIPTAGQIALTVYVHGWGLPAGSSSFKLHEWYLGTTPAGNMTVATTPPSATVGGSGTVTLGFTGLASGTRYLGSVVYGGDAAATAPTIVRIDTPP
jgi:Subtilase family/Fibronectin type-III domain/Peptidase inhibitor I9/PA domain